MIDIKQNRRPTVRAMVAQTIFGERVGYDVGRRK